MTASKDILVPHVQVLLSTYNGERHLSELLASVLGQTGVRLTILARDDGSIDGTWELLQQYARSSSLAAYRGDNLGVVGSFFRLLQDSSPEADYIALADQDDVWLEGKLAQAVTLLARQDQASPAMYCSGLTLVDDALAPLAYSDRAPRGPSFDNSLVQNIAAGCTIVLNRSARAALVRELPTVAFMHDWWIYQVVAGLGSVVYDPEPFILYRQHGANVVGLSHTPLGQMAMRLQHGVRRGLRHFGPSQLEELERIHGPHMPPARRRTLQRHLAARQTIAARLRLVFGSELVLQHRWQNVVCRCLLALNRL